MKKLAAVCCVLAALAVCFGFEMTPIHANATTIHTHNHADALYRGMEKEDTSITWQCRKCGARMYTRNGSVPSPYGCGGEFSERHVWERL